MTVLIRARIIVDENPSSPREDDNLGTFVAGNHPRYRIGDVQVDGRRGLHEHLRGVRVAVCLNVYAYEHGGIAYSTSTGYPFNDRWDAGQAGIIYVTREKMIAEYGANTEATRAQAQAVLAAEIETYSQWANGDVYGYIIERRTLCALCEAQYRAEDDETPEAPDDCPHCTIEDDSCWGFYGADPEKNGMAEYLDDDAKAAIIAEYDASNIEYQYDRGTRAEWRELAA